MCLVEADGAEQGGDPLYTRGINHQGARACLNEQELSNSSNLDHNEENKRDKGYGHFRGLIIPINCPGRALFIK